MNVIALLICVASLVASEDDVVVTYFKSLERVNSEIAKAITKDGVNTISDLENELKHKVLIRIPGPLLGWRPFPTNHPDKDYLIVSISIILEGNVAGLVYAGLVRRDNNGVDNEFAIERDKKVLKLDKHRYGYGNDITNFVVVGDTNRPNQSLHQSP